VRNRSSEPAVGGVILKAHALDADRDHERPNRAHSLSRGSPLTRNHLHKLFDSWLNPFFENPCARARIQPFLRPLRTLGILSRNIAYFAGGLRLIAEASIRMPGPVSVALLLVLAGAVYWRIHRLDCRSLPVQPHLLLVFLFVLLALMASSRSLADSAGRHVHYQYVIDIDKAIFGAVPSVWLQDHLYVSGSLNVFDAYSMVTYFSFFLAPVVVGIFLWQRSPQNLRLFAAAFMFMVICGTATFIFLPTAPPWLAANDGYLPHIHRVGPELFNLLQPGAYEEGYHAVGVNDVAAFPSYHTAQTVLIMLTIWRFGPRARILGVAYVLSMCFALAYMGEHYVADELAGIAVGGASWTLGVLITPRAARSAKSEAEPVLLQPTEIPRAA
jgi:hypothetical protein